MWGKINFLFKKNIQIDVGVKIPDTDDSINSNLEEITAHLKYNSLFISVVVRLSVHVHFSLGLSPRDS